MPAYRDKDGRGKEAPIEHNLLLNMCGMPAYFLDALLRTGMYGITREEVLSRVLTEYILGPGLDTMLEAAGFKPEEIDDRDVARRIMELSRKGNIEGIPKVMVGAKKVVLKKAMGRAEEDARKKGYIPIRQNPLPEED